MAMGLIEHDPDWLDFASDEQMRAAVLEATRRGIFLEGEIRRPAVFDADERARVVEAHNLIVAGRAGEAEALLRDVINIWNAWGER